MKVGSLDIKQTTSMAIAMVLAAIILGANNYLFPSTKRLGETRACRMEFVDRIRKQAPQNSQHKWQVYTEGQWDASLVCVCANCNLLENSNYAELDPQLLDNALRLDFTYLVFIDQKNNRTTINLGLRKLKRILGLKNNGPI